MKKRSSILIIIALVIFTGLAGISASLLEFDYDFENFFPQNDPDLDYFLEYRETFENDNDYVLISVGNKKGIFNTNFLDKANRFAEELATLSHAKEVISPTNIKTPIISSFGAIEVPLLHINDPIKLKTDSLRILKSNDEVNTIDAVASTAIVVPSIA